MSLKQFFAGLAITSIVQIVLSLLLLWLFNAGSHALFVLVTIIVLILFSLLLFAAAKKYAKSALVRLFFQLIMMAVFFKMIICLALIIIYKKGFEPADHNFIWPFIIVYIASTVYEVIFMERVGREKNPSSL